MAVETTNSKDQFILARLKMDFETNISPRFHAITDPNGYESLVYNYYLIKQKLLHWSNTLSSAQLEEVLKQYEDWYKKQEMEPPHMEWVERKRDKSKITL